MLLREHTISGFLASTLVLLLIGCGESTPDKPVLGYFSDDYSGDAVIEAAYAYADGGGAAPFEGSGVPRDIWSGNTRVMQQDTRGTYCCGYTLGILFDLIEANGMAKKLGEPEIRELLKNWYGHPAGYGLRAIPITLEKFGLGQEVAPQDLQPGDFVIFHRVNGTAHQVVFLDWVRHNGKVIGLKYRGSQASTEGIKDNSEFFAFRTQNGKIKEDEIFGGRVYDKAL